MCISVYELNISMIYLTVLYFPCQYSLDLFGFLCLLYLEIIDIVFPVNYTLDFSKFACYAMLYVWILDRFCCLVFQLFSFGS